MRRLRLPRSTLRGRDSAELRLPASLDDAAAFHRFYEDLVERVSTFFYRRTLDIEVTMDLTGETFTTAFERRGQFRGRTHEEEEGWLFAIARSQFSHYVRRGEVETAALRKLGLDPPFAGLDELEWIEQRVGVEQLKAALNEIVDELPADQRHVIIERVQHERSYAEIASELGVREEVVRARSSRGLRTLAERIEGSSLNEAV